MPQFWDILFFGSWESEVGNKKHIAVLNRIVPKKKEYQLFTTRNLKRET